MTKKKRAVLAIERLEGIYPAAICSLVYTHPYELLMATRLSAQCTDARVNVVTATLFQRFPTLAAFAAATEAEVYEIVKPCGLGQTKAKDLIGIARRLLSDYGGGVPDTMEALLTMPGVGRKTANLVLGDIYGKPAIVTDTHCIRICGRIGLTDGSKTPLAVERQLALVLPPDKSNDFCHRLVLFGREYCSARSPHCDTCPLADICRFLSGR